MSRRRKRNPSAVESSAGSTDSAFARLPLEAIAWGGASALLCASLLQPTENAWNDGSTSVHCLLWLVVLAVHLTSMFRASLGNADSNRRPASPPWGAAHLGDGLLLGLGAWVMVAAIWVLWQGEAHDRYLLNGMWQWPAFIAIYLMGRFSLSSSKSRLNVLLVMSGMTLFLSGIGLYQFLVDLPATRAAYEQASEEEKQEILRQVRVPDPTPGSRMRVLYENRLRSLEPLATFGLANSLACLLSTWFIVLAGVLVHRWKSLIKAPWAAAAVGLALLLVGLCLVLTKSRTAYLATAVGLGAILVWLAFEMTNRKRLLTIFGGFIAVIAALAVIGTAAGALDIQVLTQSFKSLQYRIEYWQATSMLITDYPLFGCGPGNFQDFYTAYKLPQASESVADPHNFLFELAATSGIPAAILAFGVAGWLTYQCGRTCFRGSDSNQLEEDVPGNAPETDDPSLNRALWIGVGLAPLLAFILAPLAGTALDLRLMISGYALAIPFWLILARWRFNLSEAAANDSATAHKTLAKDGLPCLLGLLVLGINLLAAGGISYLGIMSSLMLLLGLVNQSFAQAPITRENTGRAPVASKKSMSRDPRFALGAGLGICAVLLIGQQQTNLLPVMSAGPLKLQAEAQLSSGRLTAAEETAWAAGEADRWSAEGLRLHAYALFLQATQSGKTSDFDRWSDSIPPLLNRRPHASLLYREIGRWNLTAFGRTEEPRFLEDSIAAYEKSIEYYPNECWLHAQLAWVYHLAQKPEQARASADEAERLDQLTPHLDLKLERRPLIDQTGEPLDLPTEQALNRVRNSN